MLLTWNRGCAHVEQARRQCGTSSLMPWNKRCDAVEQVWCQYGTKPSISVDQIVWLRGTYCVITWNSSFGMVEQSRRQCGTSALITWNKRVDIVEQVW